MTWDWDVYQHEHDLKPEIAIPRWHGPMYKCSMFIVFAKNNHHTTNWDMS